MPFIAHIVLKQYHRLSRILDQINMISKYETLNFADASAKLKVTLCQLYASITCLPHLPH